MATLSVIIICLNQEEHIVSCLESVTFADEIILVDTGSTDRTLELARPFTRRIFQTTWRGYGPTKNFALDQARGEWVFSIDTDERVPATLQEEILGIVAADGPLAGYRVPRKNYLGKRWIRRLGWYPDYTLRLFQRRRGRFRERQVHEEVLVDGPVGNLATPLEHYSYASVTDYVSRQNYYARLAAAQMLQDGRRPRPGDLLWRPLAHFVKLYFLRLGFLEGRLGYTLAVLGSMYNLLKYFYLRELLAALPGSEDTDQ